MTKTPLFLVVFLLFCSLLPITFSLKFLSTQYEENIAKDAWYFEIASSCSQSNIEQWTIPTVSLLYPNIREITVFLNTTGENLGFSAYNPSNNMIFLAIRGTANIENWIEDLDAFKTTYSNCQDCEVHTGFFGAYHDLQGDILSTMRSLREKHPDALILVAGHSLGAAIATFAFVDLYEIFGKIDYFYTFGCPRVGNENFAKYINEEFGDVFKARITHYRDAVPHLPLAGMGFLHFDREVFYNEDSTQFILCNVGGEDPNCANQFSIFEPEPSDHTNYLGINLKDIKKICQ